MPFLLGGRLTAWSSIFSDAGDIACGSAARAFHERARSYTAGLIDFSVGLLSMAMLAMISAALDLRFAKDAGCELSGARRG